MPADHGARLLDDAPPPSPRITRRRITLHQAELGPEGLPILAVEQTPAFTEADRLLLGEQPGRRVVDRPVSMLPYRAQDGYARAVAAREADAVELANEHLRAVFLPELGGRLWSLVDLASGRDLLFQPDGVIFGNLALRDAWFSGGIEWNLGMTGHWGLTCSPVGAGVVDVDGQQVFRMWAFERLTRLVWRLDAWLPAGSRHLFTSARISNQTEADVPFYWWSNAAVAQHPDSRVLVPATTAAQHDYEARLARVAFPLPGDDVDGSRPATAPRAVDYFFETASADGEPAAHPWVAGCDGAGPGTLLASDSALRGKKLFVWGNTRGGRRWQRWLNGEGQYYELQSGFARTQREHITLSPGETATWVEAFGPVDGGDDALPWSDAVAHVAAQVPSAEIDAARAVFDAAADVAPEVWQQPDGWGRVEAEAGHLPADPAVPFDGAELTSEQRGWLAVAAGESPSPELARSPQTGRPWRERLTASPASWVRDLLLGYEAWSRGDRSGAVGAWELSATEQPNPMALHALAVAADEAWDAFDFAERAHEADPEDDHLLVDYLTRARTVPTLVLRVVDALPPQRRWLPRVQLAHARALIATGRHVEARTILDELELPNLREANTDLSDLWQAYREAAGVLDPLPPHLDFGMH